MKKFIINWIYFHKTCFRILLSILFCVIVGLCFEFRCREIIFYSFFLIAVIEEMTIELVDKEHRGK